jgi:hypothetical protein
VKHVFVVDSDLVTDLNGRNARHRHSVQSRLVTRRGHQYDAVPIVVPHGLEHADELVCGWHVIGELRRLATIDRKVRGAVWR